MNDNNVQNLLKGLKKKDLNDLILHLCRSNLNNQMELIKWLESRKEENKDSSRKTEETGESKTDTSASIDRTSEKDYQIQLQKLDILFDQIINIAEELCSLEDCEEYYDYMNGCGDWWYNRKYGWERENKVEKYYNDAYKLFEQYSKMAEQILLPASLCQEHAQVLAKMGERLLSAYYEDLGFSFENMSEQLTQKE